MNDFPRADETDLALGELLAHLSNRAACAWSEGDVATAERWWGVAVRVRGGGSYVEIAPSQTQIRGTLAR